jgi:hypothetical protein
LTKRFLHPEVGLLKLNYTHLWLGQRLGTRMTTYTPADEQTAERLRALHDSVRLDAVHLETARLEAASRA